MLATRLFGETKRQVTAVGLGGEGVLRTQGQKGEAVQVIQKVLDLGVTYFDSARVYGDSELYYGSVWGADPGTRSRIFQASKSASRDRQGALADLAQTLARLQTAYLDLWQIHDIRTAEELEMIAGPQGALGAFVEARSSGKVRFIGVTGHHDPQLLTRAVREWPVDSVMMPINPVEGILGGFLTSTLPAAKEKGMAIIGMKVLGGSHYLHSQLGIAPEMLIRYAMSHDPTVVIVGCSTAQEVERLTAAGSDGEPMSRQDKEKIIKRFQPYAKRLAFYRGVL